ncbi:YgjP-like metallopeptidase domain-containing protein [Streptomyces sp. NPDC091416]|uniref:YgjP-like metallopeptidase domain-containing protein n=1 Tax=Streptomyces sp. NPDC091416 TaxID=3366003 RepID=UPI0037F1592A
MHPTDLSDEVLIRTITAALEADGILTSASFDVVVSRRRTTHAVTTRPDGRRVVRILPTSTAAEITQFVRLNASRLADHARQMATRAPRHPDRRLTDGCELFWLGHSVRLHLVDTPVPVHMRQQEDGTGLLVVHRGDLERCGAQPIIDWYARAGRAWLEGAAPAHWARLRTRRPLPRLEVRDLGRCNGAIYQESAHQLTLHWAVFQLPPVLLEYVLVHELVHGTRPRGRSHGPEFRTRLLRVMPDALIRHEQFRAAYRFLWIGTTP